MQKYEEDLLAATNYVKKGSALDFWTTDFRQDDILFTFGLG